MANMIAEIANFDLLLSRVESPTPECRLGLALIAKNQRPPVYDALTVALCFSNARGEIDSGRAQLALESLKGYDRARLDALILELVPGGPNGPNGPSGPNGPNGPKGKLRVVMFTDVGLKNFCGETTADTDDWVAIALMCDIAKLGSNMLDHFTLVLSHRKKGEVGRKDRTTPMDVSEMMAARIGSSVNRIDSTTFLTGNTFFRVFQQEAQTTPSAHASLTVDEMLGLGGDESVQLTSAAALSELRGYNSAMLGHLRAVHCAGGQTTVVLGCGPIDVVTADTLCGCLAWTVSYSDPKGVNSGSVHTDAQHSNRGAAVFAANGNIVDITARVSRGTSTTDHIILDVCDAAMLDAVAKNAAKVAGVPMLLYPAAPGAAAIEQATLVWRILASNTDTLQPRFWDALRVGAAVEPPVSISAFGAAVAATPLVPQQEEIEFYAANFGLTLLANTLLAAGQPMDVEGALSTIAGGVRTCVVRHIVEYGALPDIVVGMVAAQLPRAGAIRTAHELFVVATLAMAARLSGVMSTAREFGVDVAVVAKPATLHLGGLRIHQPLAFSYSANSANSGSVVFEPPQRMESAMPGMAAPECSMARAQSSAM